MGNVQGGGACECPRVGVFVIFWRADDVTRTMSKGGGCACECLDPPPFRKSWIRACTGPTLVNESSNCSPYFALSADLTCSLYLNVISLALIMASDADKA